ncbi:type II toxin-antitoxin system HicA family toxin [Serratia ureilytica]|nr:type II toxin-antitoxin system HicA family toxin [Serratia ureilytica]
MNKRHQKTLSNMFSRPVNASKKWPDIEAIFNALGAEIHEREGFRISVLLKGGKRVFHRPPDLALTTGEVNSIRIWLDSLGIKA